MTFTATSSSWNKQMLYYRGNDEKRYTEIPPIPEGTTHLDVCFNPELTELPPLPEGLINLDCSATGLSSLVLPESLLEFSCSYSKFKSLPALPAGLTDLVCGYNRELAELPPLPKGLRVLMIDYTAMTVIPRLPETLRVFLATGAPLAEPFATYNAEYRKELRINVLIDQVNAYWDKLALTPV